jgi:hypothetical protein
MAEVGGWLALAVVDFFLEAAAVVAFFVATADAGTTPAADAAATSAIFDESDDESDESDEREAFA